MLELKKSIKGVEHKRKIGVQTNVFVLKSTIGTPHQEGLMRILFDYGIDDIATNLLYLKRTLKKSTFVINEEKIGQSINKAIQHIESNNLERKLRKEVIQLWTYIQKQLTPERKRKRRF